MGAGDSALPAVAGDDDTTVAQRLEVMVQRWNGYNIPALRSRNWSNRQSTRTRMEMAVGDTPVPEIAESPVTTTAESSEVTPVTSSQLPPLQSNAILPQVVAGIESPAVAGTDASTTETTQPQSPAGEVESPEGVDTVAG